MITKQQLKPRPLGAGSLGKLLEERAKSSTSSAIKKMMGLQPKTVRIVEDGIEKEIAVADVKVGQLIVPANTFSPDFFSTGKGSPEIMLSSTNELPS